MTFFPDLKRPQYPSSPEVLLSALAWSVIPRADGQPGTGLIYYRRGSRGRRDVDIIQTMPRGDSLRAFLDSLGNSGWRASSGELPIEVAEAAVDSLRGVMPEKGVGCASSGIGLAGALLQDPVGGLATKAPPNFAKLINTIYALGGGDASPSAAERWFWVAHYYSEQGDLKALERAFTSTTLKPFISSADWPPKKPEAVASSISEANPEWWNKCVIDQGIGTPFTWFRDSWDRLCSPEWYESLPPRRWAGWAVCVLRTAIGFAFLWEANFFIEIARGIVDPERDPETVARWALAPTRPLIPYQRGGISQMNVMPSIHRLLSLGLACRKAILEQTQLLVDQPETLAKMIEVLRALPHTAVSEAIAGRGDRGGLSNLVETVRYSLVDRSNPELPDQYALLKVVSRNFTHVAPAPEWIVVMAAMSSVRPTAVVRLGDVRRSLDGLGFKPRIDFLLGELERAGLCASASDGDEGIEINLGFGRT